MKLLSLTTVLMLISLMACSQSNTDGVGTTFANLEEKVAFQEAFETKLTALFQRYQLAGDFIIGVVDQEGLHYSLALNRDILAGKKSDLDIHSPLYLASHTKSFTGTLLRILEEEGKVDLDTPITNYIPEFTFGGKVSPATKTTRSFLNHTHGVNSGPMTWKTAFLGYEGGNATIIHDLNDNPRYDRSGRFRYSNTGPIVAGLVADAVTGNSWKEEQQKRIFDRLGMQETSANVSDFDLNSIRPAVLVGPGSKVLQSGFYKKDIIMHAAGGTLSTVHDLALWLQANIKQDERLMSKAAWKDMHTLSAPQEREYFTYQRFGYSLGWDLADYYGDTLVSRFGSYAGIVFHASFIPQRELGVIAFTSDSRAAHLGHLAANYAYNLIAKNPETEAIFEKEEKQFAKVLKRVEESTPVFDKKDLLQPNKQLDQMIGIYHNAEGWPEIEVRKEKGTYFFRWGVLEGEVYQTEEAEQPYVGALGTMTRSFGVNGSQLFTGSLVFTKEGS